MINSPISYTVFEGPTLLFRGQLIDVVQRTKARLGKSTDNSSLLIFSDSTGKIMDFNFQGSEADVLKRLDVFVQEAEPKDNSGPGRPKLGVISREVSLLPRHWEWLASQTGGASAVLRRLIDEARRKSFGGNGVKQAQERTYRFMSVLAGDLKGYEEALRALYKRDEEGFLRQTESWPHDVRKHAIILAHLVFSDEPC
jgi:hypothetical protein